MKNSSVRRLFAMLALALCLLGAHAVQADDGVFNGEGASIYPINEPDISLDYELLTIEPRKAERLPNEEDLQVDALFVLRNTGGPKTVTIGFPEEYGYSPGTEEDLGEGSPTIREFTATVDGSPVKTVIQPLERRNADFHFDRAYIWRVSFERGQTRVIRNTYWFTPSYSSTGDWEARYILRTGALWAGPIGRIDIYFRSRIPVDWMNFVPYPHEYSEFHAVGWEPDRDIILTSNVHQDYPVFLRGKPYYEPLLDDTHKEDIGVYREAAATRRALIRSYIAGLRPERLATCTRGEIQSYLNGYYATYGRPFTSKEWNAFFGARWWYEADPKYTDARLNAADKMVISLLLGYYQNALTARP